MTDKTGSEAYSFSIAGMGIGTYSWQIELYYKKLGTQGNTTHYGVQSIDETTGESRYFLTVTSDLTGRSTSLRGSTLNCGTGNVTFRQDGSSSPDLGRADRVKRTEHTWGTSEIQYFDSHGLEVTFINGEPVEYFIHQ